MLDVGSGYGYCDFILLYIIQLVVVRVIWLELYQYNSQGYSNMFVIVYNSIIGVAYFYGYAYWQGCIIPAINIYIYIIICI